jgi:hypothetical protein
LEIRKPLIASQRHARPYQLDDPERPRARQESIDAGKEAASRETEREDLAAALERVHQHHETDGEDTVDGYEHGSIPHTGGLVSNVATVVLPHPLKLDRSPGAPLRGLRSCLGEVRDVSFSSLTPRTTSDLNKAGSGVLSTTSTPSTAAACGTQRGIKSVR